MTTQETKVVGLLEDIQSTGATTLLAHAQHLPFEDESSLQLPMLVNLTTARHWSYLLSIRLTISVP